MNKHGGMMGGDSHNPYGGGSPYGGDPNSGAGGTPFMSGGIPMYGTQGKNDYMKGYTSGTVNARNTLRLQLAMEKEAENRAREQQLAFMQMLLQAQIMQEQSSARDMQMLAALKAQNAQGISELVGAPMGGGSPMGGMGVPSDDMALVGQQPSDEELAYLMQAQMQGIPPEAMGGY